MMGINWEALSISALTSIRCQWPVSKLEQYAAEGYPTPVSGDVLAEER